ncbi:MAG: LytTR family DNA-binding domain-containing protein [Bacteroides sp.]|nr:LytTR family DNA-binding domain-containing protein [Bacteroides sp.]
MKIAVCDDSREIQLKLAELIKKQSDGAETVFFFSGEELAGAEEEYDIIFLDIAMKKLSGIDTAKRLRERREKNGGRKSIIIFVTAFKDYMEEAFDVNAFHYLVKPISEEKFARVFAAALKEADKEKNAGYIVIKSGGAQHKLPLRDICYVESSNKKAIYHTKNGVFPAYGKMDELENRLGSGFYRCHRCFLVNMESVCSYGFDYITVINGDRLLLAKKKYSEFVKAYLKYAKEGGIVNV